MTAASIVDHGYDAHSRRRLPPGEFGGVDPLENANWTNRILGLYTAGHSFRRIVEIGEYQQTWDADYARRVFRVNGIEPPHVVKINPPPGVKVVLLTPAEDRVLRLMCNGLNVREIAQETDAKQPTIQGHIRAIIDAADARDRLQVVVWALTRQLAVQIVDRRKTRTVGSTY